MFLILGKNQKGGNLKNRKFYVIIFQDIVIKIKIKHNILCLRRDKMIKVYGKENCGRCETLKRTLERKGLDYWNIQKIYKLL